MSEIIRGWRVGHNDLGYVFARAATRHGARRFWPGDADFTGVRVLRAAWLDGPGSDREIDAVYVPCVYDEDDPDPECWEGEKLSKELTLAALGEGS